MNISIIGSGAYGLALGTLVISNKDNKLKMWTFDENEQNMLAVQIKSIRFDGYEVPENIFFTMSLEEAMKDTELVVMAIPGVAFEKMSIEVSKYLTEKQHVLIATKGIDNKNSELFSDVFLKYNPNAKISVMSGPSFAEDIIKGSYIGFTLASKFEESNDVVIKAFINPKNIIKVINDMVGIQICSAIKNVVALGSGILSGMDETPSTIALFLTNAINNIKDLIDCLGGDRETILSYAGFGDYVMTTTSNESRNYSYGYMIGKGKNKDELESYLKSQTVEGVYTLDSINKIIKTKNLKMPIIEVLYGIIRENGKKEDILSFLISNK